jgi:hypothetical protein
VRAPHAYLFEHLGACYRGSVAALHTVIRTEPLARTVAVRAARAAFMSPADLKMLPRYCSRLSAYFNTPEYWAFISDNVAGNAQPNCNASKLSALPIPLAPAAEQQRIVAKLEECFKGVNAGRERVDSVPRILKAFRQSVLAAACSGRLTCGLAGKKLPKRNISIVGVKGREIASNRRRRTRLSGPRVMAMVSIRICRSVHQLVTEERIIQTRLITYLKDYRSDIFNPTVAFRPNPCTI